MLNYYLYAIIYVCIGFIVIMLYDTFVYQRIHWGYIRKFRYFYMPLNVLHDMERTAYLVNPKHAWVAAILAVLIFLFWPLTILVMECKRYKAKKILRRYIK